MEKNTPSTGHQDSPSTPGQTKKLRTKRPRKSAPGPGDSQEGARREYHEEPSPKTNAQHYDHEPEKNLED